MTNNIPLPSLRIGTRVVLPLVIVGSALAILAWSSWRAWAPLTIVQATPVVVRTSSGTSVQKVSGANNTTARGAAVLAPGWVEASPFPVAASALTNGVVKEVLVLEGDRVEAQQVVARLIDDQAKLVLRKAEADVQIKSAELSLLEDELHRKQKLIAVGGVSEGEVARLAIKVTGSKAALELTAAARDETLLVLQRTEVRAPVAGVVMARMATPGSLVGMDAQSAAVVLLFDPRNLQVRTDVPPADAGRLRVGQFAEVQFESLPNQIVRGRVIILGQQADIAKNTLQAKVLLENPPAGLVPDMLARVRILLDSAPNNLNPMQAEQGATNSGQIEIAVPESILTQLVTTTNGNREGTLRVVIDIREGVGEIVSRSVVAAAPGGAYTAVFSGLLPGDCVVLPESPSTHDGESVRVQMIDNIHKVEMPASHSNH